MSKRKQLVVVLERGGWVTTWRNGPPKPLFPGQFRKRPHSDTVEVDVTNPEGKLVLEWTYGKVAGRGLRANAVFWLDQALLQAGKGIKHAEEEEGSEPSKDQGKPERLEQDAQAGGAGEGRGEGDQGHEAVPTVTVKAADAPATAPGAAEGPGAG